jgi:hypothetical protein
MSRFAASRVELRLFWIVSGVVVFEGRTIKLHNKSKKRKAGYKRPSAYTQIQPTDVEDFFGIKLPGLRPAK